MEASLPACKHLACAVYAWSGRLHACMYSMRRTRTQWRMHALSAGLSRGLLAATRDTLAHTQTSKTPCPH
eukprot:359937-Chlamydomonas_euryale.AAC.12